MADAHIRALTARHPIKPTSPRCPSAWQPNPGGGSTYRCGKSVQTTGTTSKRHFLSKGRATLLQLCNSSVSVAIVSPCALPTRYAPSINKHSQRGIEVVVTMNRWRGVYVEVLSLAF